MSDRASFSLVSASDTGCVRTCNEDAVQVHADIGLLMVADGMGGHNAGDVASQMACSVISEHMRESLGQHAAGGDVLRELRQALVTAHGRILHSSRLNAAYENMGSTAVAALLHDNQLHLVHIGDTRAYLLRDGSLQLLTRDHSPIQQVMEAGLANDEVLTNSHSRHLVSEALGAPGAEDAFQTVSLPLLPEDVVLLCSDGLNDMVDGEDIELILTALNNNLSLCAQQLVMVAKDCGGHDNVSVALARVDAPFPARSPAQPNRSATPLFARLRSWFSRTPA